MNARPHYMSIRIGSMARILVAFSSHRLVATVLFAAIMAVLAPQRARAEEPPVTAPLSSSATGVGEPGQLQIKISGARNAAPSVDIAVDGLDIRSAGQMQSFEMRGFDISSSVTYNYT